MFCLADENDELEMRIKLNLCESLDVFEKDTQRNTERITKPKSLLGLYSRFCEAAGIPVNEQTISKVRKCVFHLQDEARILNKWRQMRRHTNTPKQKSFPHSVRRSGHVFLAPPVQLCMNPECGAQLTLQNRSELRCLTENGQIKAIGLSYKCRKSNCRYKQRIYHYNDYVDGVQNRTHYSGFVGGDQYPNLDFMLSVQTQAELHMDWLRLQYLALHQKQHQVCENMGGDAVVGRSIPRKQEPQHEYLDQRLLQKALWCH